MSAAEVWTGAAGARRTAAGRAAAVLRLGRRTVRAGGWRSALVVALIALGVATAVVVAVGLRSTRVPREVQTAAALGTADLRVDEPFTGGVRFEDLTAAQQQAYLDAVGRPPARLAVDLRPVPDLVAEVAPDARLLPLAERHLGRLRLLAVDLADPLAQGLLADPAATPGDGEALLTAAALDHLDARVGGAVDLPEVGRVEVVGVVAHPHHSQEVLAVLAPGALGDPTSWLVDLGGDVSPTRLDAVALAVQQAAQDPGAGCTTAAPCPPEGPSRSVQARTTPDDVVLFPAERLVTDPAVVGTAAGTLVLTMVAFVAAAAFATGLRRRIREVGLLGATGAAPRQVRQVALVEAAVLGGAGVVAGVGGGVLAALLGRPVLQALTRTTVTDLDIAPADVLLPAVVGVVAAVLAAAWPSRTAARTPVVTALAGRVPLRHVPRWLPPASLAVTAVGLLLVVVVVRAFDGSLLTTAVLALALVAVALGAATLGVPLLGLGGRLADRLPALPRLVLRDAVRQRTRSGALVAALVVVLLLPTLALVGVASTDAYAGAVQAQQPAVLISGPFLDPVQLPPAEDAVTRVRAALPVQPTGSVEVTALGGLPTGVWPGVEVRPLDEVGGASSHAPGQSPQVLATRELLAAVEVDGELADAVLAGDVVLDIAVAGTLSEAQRAAGRRPAEIVVSPGDGASAPRRIEVELVSVESDLPAVAQSVALAPDLAEDVGLAPIGTSTILRLPRELTDEESRPFWEGTVLAESQGYAGLVGGGSLSSAPARWVAVAVACAAVLVLTGTATALAATESDRDLRTMSAVGAAPSTRRRFHGLQAAYHGLLAALIALPTGVLLYLAVQRGTVALVLGGVPDEGGGIGSYVVLPVPELLALGVGVPLAAGAVMWLVMRPAAPVADRRIS
jgi:putative ABC transport system permease protein